MFSTRYKHRKDWVWYTTKTLTDYHAFLREHHDGVTYEHHPDSALYLVPGMALEKPVGGMTVRIQ